MGRQWGIPATVRIGTHSGFRTACKSSTLWEGTETEARSHLVGGFRSNITTTPRTRGRGVAGLAWSPFTGDRGEKVDVAQD